MPVLSSKQYERDILGNNGMPCAMSWKIEKCRAKHFGANEVRASIIRLSALPRVPLQISFPINVNYVIFSHKCLKQKADPAAQNGAEKSGEILSCFAFDIMKWEHYTFCIGWVSKRLTFLPRSNALNGDRVPEPSNRIYPRFIISKQMYEYMDNREQLIAMEP